MPDPRLERVPAIVSDGYEPMTDADAAAYTAGRELLVASNAALARRFNCESPAQAVAAARLALDVPNRLEPDANANRGLTHGLGSIVEVNRGLISDHDIESWDDALHYFDRGDQTHLAGIAAIELAVAGRVGGQDRSASLYRTALDYLGTVRNNIESFAGGAKDLAWLDTIECHRREALRGAVGVLTLDAADGCKVTGCVYEVAKSLVYELDDLDGATRLTHEGYAMLQRSGGLRRLRERVFFGGEAARIAGQLALDKRLARPGAIVLNPPGPRPDRRSKRPEARL